MDDRSFVAAQDFLLSAKTYWSTTMYRTLRDKSAAANKDVVDEQVETVASIAQCIEDAPLYQFYAWLERHLQRMKYAGRYGLVPYHHERRDDLLSALNQAFDAEKILDIDTSLALPAYYTGVDIHQHPGGVWSDAIAGMVYERGARTTTPLTGAAEKDVHERFTDLVLGECSPTTVLDMGCGFGKSTQPFVRRLPDSSIDAVDLSAPCLRLAADTALQSQAGNVRFRQMNACDTDFDADSFDLVTSTMVLHELPPKTIEELLDEAFRVLSPGGRMVHLDFYCVPDAFRRFVHYGHARRNNEPYMQPLAELDLSVLVESKGFVDVEITPFQESDRVDLNADDAWRFPWTVISATKPEGAAS
ncbi:MAG: methyltransferase domain-containing protein [Alphaproteobacteria bacterium]|nr:methyltransferase domain-containing protein [Alphaproteobacteria bacterium]